MNDHKKHKGLDLERFAEEYFNYSDKTTDKHFQAWDFFWELGHTDPESAWELILILVKMAKNKRELSYLAAGPLEDLVDYHGELFIDRIENEVRKNNRFAWTILCVWPGKRNKEIYERFTKLQKKYKNHTIPLSDE